MSFLILIMGAAIGGALAEISGAVFGAALGYVLGKLFGISKRLTSLESQMAALNSTLQTASWSGDRLKAGRESEASGNQHLAPDVLSGVQATEEIQESVDGGEGSPATPAKRFAREEFEADDTKGEIPDLEFTEERPSTIWNTVEAHFIGGNLLVKVGIVLLFVGVAFLLKYAAEHQWFPVELRLIGVALLGIALLGIGWRLRRQRKNYAVVLQGGGVGVLNLTLFAAFRLYDLLPPVLAFLILVAIGTLSATIAVLEDSVSLAVLGVAGGFLAPILTSPGGGSHVILFSYYALLNASILGIAWFKAWRALNLVGFVFTFSVGTTWGMRFYQPAFFTTTEPFLAIFFLFYVAVAILFAQRQPNRLDGYVDGTLVFGTPIIVFALQGMLVRPYEHATAFSALLLGFFYLGLAWILIHRKTERLQMLTEAFFAIGVAFGTLAVPLALDNRWTASAWALEGAAMIWIGVRQKRLLARACGALLQLGAGFAFLVNLSRPPAEWPVLNGFYLGCVVVSLSGLFTSLYCHRNGEKLNNWESSIAVAMGIWGLLWWYGAGLNEIDRHIAKGYHISSDLLFLGFSCLALNVIGRRLRWEMLHYHAVGLLPAMYVLAWATLLSRSHPFADRGYAAWPVALAVFYRILYHIEGSRKGLLEWLHAGALWLLTLIIAWEAGWQVGNWVQGSTTWSIIVWGLLPSLPILLITTRAYRLHWPVDYHQKAYLVQGLAPIVSFVWLWTLYVNITNDGSSWPLSYLPVLNALDVTIGFVHAAIWSYLLRLRTSPEILSPLELRVESTIRLVHFACAVSLFIWLNAILVRTVHHWAGVEFSRHAMFGSVILQTSLSIAWSLTAFCVMLYSTRRAARNLWLSGAGLLAVVVLKLFTIDLSKTGTVERIISFIAVGILLLIIGYFAPAPPRSNKPGDSDTTVKESTEDKDLR